MGFATATAIASLGFGAYQTINAASEAKEYKEEMNKARETEPTNSFEDVTVETEKYDNARDAAASLSSTAIDAASRDTRSLVPVAGAASEGFKKTNEGLLGLIAQEEARVAELFGRGELEKQRMVQRAEEMNLLGLGQAYQTARQDIVGGVANMVTSGLAIGSGLGMTPAGSSGGGSGGSESTLRDPLIDSPINTEGVVIGDVINEQPGAMARRNVPLVASTLTPQPIVPLGQVGDVFNSDYKTMSDIMDELLVGDSVFNPYNIPQ